MQFESSEIKTKQPSRTGRHTDDCQGKWGVMESTCQYMLLWGLCGNLFRMCVISARCCGWNCRLPINFSEVGPGPGEQPVCTPVMFHSFHRRAPRRQRAPSRCTADTATKLFTHPREISIRRAGCLLRLFWIANNILPKKKVKKNRSCCQCCRRLNQHQPVCSIHTLKPLNSVSGKKAKQKQNKQAQKSLNSQYYLSNQS